MRILVVGPGASWSTSDVEAGLVDGLEAGGATVIRYRLDERIDHARRFLRSAWLRGRRRGAPVGEAPTWADACYLAAQGVLERALRFEVDAVLAVSTMFLHPDAIVIWRRAGLYVTVLFTETPYDLEAELRVARLIHGCWVPERTAVPAFQAVTRARYLPHAFHPRRHGLDRPPDDTPAHDVLFVGSGFPARVAWLSAVDWTGIDLGLYGAWPGLGPRSRMRRYVRGGVLANAAAVALYRRAAINLNLYRDPAGAPAESLNPRAYELAACGAFHLSTPRAEVAERFGPAVPIVRDPFEAGAVIRAWLADPAGRAAIAATLPGCVAGSSWVERAATVLADLEMWRRQTVAA